MVYHLFDMPKRNIHSFDLFFYIDCLLFLYCWCRQIKYSWAALIPKTNPCFLRFPKTAFCQKRLSYVTGKCNIESNTINCFHLLAWLYVFPFQLYVSCEFAPATSEPLFRVYCYVIGWFAFVSQRYHSICVFCMCCICYVNVCSKMNCFDEIFSDTLLC